MKISLFYTLSFISLVFLNNCDKKQVSDMITLNSKRILPDKIEISYAIKNIHDYDIWICDGINRISKGDICLKGKTLFLRLFSSLPYDKYTYYYYSPVAYYSKLAPKSSADRSVEMELPVKYLSFGSDEFVGEKVASKLTLQVGYFADKELSRLGEWAKRESESRLAVPVIRDGGEIEEKILEVEIFNNVEILVAP